MCLSKLFIIKLCKNDTAIHEHVNFQTLMMHSEYVNVHLFYHQNCSVDVGYSAVSYTEVESLFLFSYNLLFSRVHASSY